MTKRTFLKEAREHLRNNAKLALVKLAYNSRSEFIRKQDFGLKETKELVDEWWSKEKGLENIWAGITTTHKVLEKPYLWLKQIGDTHIAGHNVTLCDIPMLGNNYANQETGEATCKKCIRIYNKQLKQQTK
jgi:hypothetical protein